MRKKLHIPRTGPLGETRAVRARRPHRGGARRGYQRMQSFGVRRYRYLVTVPLLLAAILFSAHVKMPKFVTERYRPVRHAVNNPLMGWAVDATTDPEAVEIAHTLVHANLSWRELEPEEGQYTFEAFEERNHIEQWRALGMRIVLRFVLDQPGEGTEMDIPDWLYEAMGERAGSFYDNWVGKGFSPNYNNYLLQQKHADALAALGKRYNDDPFVAFLELGSLGHDGEWWVDRESGVPALPLLTEVRNYISAYSYAFPGTPMLSVHPYQATKLIQAGLYNPFLGNADWTWNWIDMITYGGYEEQIGTNLRGMGESFYTNTLSGAQMSRDASARALLGANPERLVDQLLECHTSYVSGAPATGLSEAEQSGMRIAQEVMGYRLWVRSAQWPRSVRPGYNLRLGLTIRNSGVAPMSQSWPFRLYLIRDGEIMHRQDARIDVRQLQPGESRVDADIEAPVSLPSGQYQIGVAIIDPWTGEPGVELAMVSRKQGLISILGDVMIE